MRIVCVGYRDWALRIYKNIHSSHHQILTISSKSDLAFQRVREFAPDFVLFYGWSWMVGDDFLQSFRCLMLHPSPLPRYRGGSPIQNQIIQGELVSAVTIFLMEESLDSGPIYAQEPFSLEGDLSDIFDRIVDIGTRLTKVILCGDIIPKPQDDSTATYCQRRKPEESEITLLEIQTSTAEYIYNKIRMLQDPYPSAFIIGSDGKKVFINSASIESGDRT